MNINELIQELERALTKHYLSDAESQHSSADYVYMVASILEEQGVGAVLAPTMNNGYKWLNLDTLEF